MSPFMRAPLALLLAGSIVLCGGTASRAADAAKLALVIGNAKYPDNEFVLNDATNDSLAVAEELKRDGFVVDQQSDLTADTMRQVLDRFYARIERGAVALIFFDGFGIQSNRQTYLLPVDAQIWTEPDVSRDGFSVDTILAEMNTRGAAIKIALIDASRRNPFERRFRRYSAGLAPAIAPNNSLVLYSAALGAVTAGGKTDRGLFVAELLREMRAPNIGAEQALANTRNGVVAATNREQVPWLSSSLTTEFSFAGQVTGPPDNKPASQTQTKPGVQQPACEVPQAEPAPGADDLARDPVIADLTRKIAANGNDTVSRYKRGQVYAIKRAYALAMQDFDGVIRRDPRDAEALNNRCWTRAATGDLPGALADCNLALQMNPGLSDAFDSRGLVNLKLGRNPEAIKDYTDAIQRNPRSSSSLFGRGIATRRSGGDGANDIAQAKSMNPNIAKEFAGYGVSECVP
ncbi:caspase family protein [Bradyrhizobium diazoefficiens]|nr:caspase family protein [Bradyrhizobium diazoefficiens]UCF52055.1 MAG: caspase family protein [Bradyrhizobium sp.]MBR0978891.1 caspase family protein [Bradyrhizobium diazoefficiens]MBR1006705.1 caspase family protein [Bradyrhizobium diazoefficiens]MBR1014439.1 caspase family protein [Bradyrhizobium diazoefficiens]